MFRMEITVFLYSSLAPNWDYANASCKTRLASSCESHVSRTFFSVALTDTCLIQIAMSFGFSVGDFIATSILIKEIVTALSSSSVAEYRELQLELQGLERALDTVEHLQPAADEELAVSGLKVAALSCRYTLQELYTDLSVEIIRHHRRPLQRQLRPS